MTRALLELMEFRKTLPKPLSQPPTVSQSRAGSSSLLLCDPLPRGGVGDHYAVAGCVTSGKPFRSCKVGDTEEFRVHQVSGLISSLSNNAYSSSERSRKWEDLSQSDKVMPLSGWLPGLMGLIQNLAV